MAGRQPVRGVAAPGPALVLRLLAGLAMALALLAAGAPGSASPRHALVLTIAGPIGPASADYLSRGLAQAREQGAAALVLRIDTPGGLDTSMREMIREVVNAPLPVLAWVGPSGARAASAGTYIVYASHVAAMAPGTNLGAATPVQLGGGGLPGRPDSGNDDSSGAKESEPKGGASKPRTPSPTEAKAINDAVAYIRSLAELRGRNADWAESAVREAASLSAKAALEKGVTDIVAGSIEDLLKQAHDREVRIGDSRVTLDTAGLAVQAFDPDWRTRLLGAITNPNVALILMMIGVYGLFFEFYNPGFGVPGVVGAICLLLGLYALQQLPVNYAGLALIVLGIAFMVAEAFMPSFGILGLGGIAAFVFGAVILIDTDVPGFGIPIGLIVGLALISAVTIAAIVGFALKARRRPVVSGEEELIGSTGEVVNCENGQCWARVHSELWKVQAAEPLRPGQPVKVTGRKDLTLTVSLVGPKGE